MTKKQKQAFIAKLAKAVKKYAPDYGIKCCSVPIAQGILESGWGESKLTKDYNNLFGLKCGTLWKGKSVNMETQEEFEPGTKTTISDNFRVYDSFDDGVRGYFEFLGLARYQNLKGITDPRKYAGTIKADGYATDSKYVTSLMSLVEEWDLTQYDPKEDEAKEKAGSKPDAGKEKTAVESDTGKKEAVTASDVGKKETIVIDPDAGKKETIVIDPDAGKKETIVIDPDAGTNNTRSADELIAVMKSWLGYSEANGRHMEIINLYNSHKPLARGYAVQNGDAWCATTVSAAAIKAGMTDIIPLECGCEEQIKLFQKLGCWEEDGTVVPEPGFIIYYNWDKGSQPNDGWADHVGVVVSVDSSLIKVIEGNNGGRVAYRTIPVGWAYIRGYGKPRYGKAATVKEEKEASGSTGTSRVLSKEPKWVGRVTVSALNVRSWAGTEYATIRSWPLLYKGNLADVCDSVNDSHGNAWYYIRINGRIFGFVSAQYIERA